VAADARRRRTQARRRARGRNVAYSLLIVYGLVGQLLEEELRKVGLADNDLGLLSAIGVGGGAVTPTMLAEHLGRPPTTLTTRIARLVDRGLVRRVQHPVDRRSYMLQLTESGHQEWKRSGPALRSTLARVERELRLPIDDVEETLVELERALRAALEEERSTSALGAGRRAR
jgi:DNA-binding MarR family transcriptional regulator